MDNVYSLLCWTIAVKSKLDLFITVTTSF